MLVSSIPFLGGSTKTTSALAPFASIRFESSSSTSPQINSAFSTLFNLAFSFAFSTAASTISIPYTFFANEDTKIPIVPIP